MKNKKIIIISKNPNISLSPRTKFLINLYKIFGYDYEIVYPTDTCRGHRANIISWIDDFPDFPKDITIPLDKPSNS